MQIKRMNWFRKVPEWKVQQARREHMSRMTSDFLQKGALAANAFLSAQTNLTYGLATIAAQRSVDRVAAELAAKKASVDKLA